MKAALFFSGLLAVSCAGAEEPQPESQPAGTAAAPDAQGSRQNPYEGRGIIREVRDGQLVIEHEEIPGFMGAMTMQFPVAEEAEVESLEPGDEVTFAIEVLEDLRYRIFRIEEMGPDSDESN